MTITTTRFDDIRGEFDAYVGAGYPLGRFWQGVGDPKLHILRLTPWRIQVIRGGDLRSRMWRAAPKAG